MTTLKNLKGTAIQFLDADPVVYVGTWSAGGSYKYSKSILGGGSGIQTAAISFWWILHQILITRAQTEHL